MPAAKSSDGKEKFGTRTHRRIADVDRRKVVQIHQRASSPSHTSVAITRQCTSHQTNKSYPNVTSTISSAFVLMITHTALYLQLANTYFPSQIFSHFVGTEPGLMARTLIDTGSKN